MRGRLLCGMLLMSVLMLIFYYKLVIIHPELLSGFITIIAVTMSHIWNSAEDILASLFKIGDQPTTPLPKAPVIAPGDPLGAPITPKVVLP